MASDRRVTLAQGRRLITRALRDPASVLRLAPSDLDLTLRLMRRARLLGRLAADLQDLGLLEMQPPVIADQLYSALAAAQARARVGRWELDRIAWALRDLPGVPIVAMKGCAYLLAGTPNARGRTFADVDLMVPETDIPAVEGRLKERGWRATELTPYDDRYYRAWAHELPPLLHVEREVEVDLHHNILMRTARLKPSSALLLEASRPVAGSRFRVLAPVDMVLHAMVHLFYGGEMDDALRELVDIDGLLRHFGEHEAGFWEGFWARAEQLDLARVAFYGLRYTTRLLDTPAPTEVLQDSSAGAPLAPVLWLMDGLVPRGLFPTHPDVPSQVTSFARLTLYARSHWVKMPPLMLAGHLTHKFRVRHSKQALPEPGAA